MGGEKTRPLNWDAISLLPCIHLATWQHRPNEGPPVSVRNVVSTLLPANLVVGCQTIKGIFGAKRESMN